MKISLSLSVMAVANLFVSFAIQGYIIISLGPGPSTDAYFAAQTIPIFISGIVSSALVRVLVPVFISEDAEKYRRTAVSFVVISFLILGGVTLIIMALTEFWVPLFFPGFNDESKEMIIHLSHIYLFTLVLSGPLSVLVSTYHSRHQFYWVELSQLLASCIFFVFILWALPNYGIVVVAWLAILRLLMQLALLSPWAKIWCMPDIDLDVIRLAWRRIKPLLLGASIYKSGPIIDRFLASMSEAGGLSLLVFSQKIYSAGLVAMDKAIAGPMVTISAKHEKQENIPALLSAYWKRWVSVLVVTGAGLAFLIIFSTQILGIFIAYGKVSNNDIKTLQYLMILLSGMLLGGGAGQISAAGLYGVGKTAQVTKIALTSFIISVAVKCIGFFYAGIYGIAVGIAFYQISNATLLHIVFLKVLRVMQHNETEVFISKA